MRELQTTLLHRTTQLERSIVGRLLGKVSDSAPIQLVKDSRIMHVQEQLLLKWAAVPPERKRGVFLFLAVVIGIAIGASLRFRKQPPKDQPDASLTRKRGQILFLATAIGAGVGAVLWFRKRRQVDSVAPVRTPDVSIFLVYPPSPVQIQSLVQIESERVVQPPAAMPLLRSTIVPQDEPTIPQVVAASFAPQLPVTQQSPVKRTLVSQAEKRGLLLLLLLLLIILVVGAGIWFGPLGHPTARVAGVASSPIITRAVPTTAPILTKTYNGTIYDLGGNVQTRLSLTKFQQYQGKLSGYLTVGPQLQGSGTFTGTIDSTQHFQFTVVDATGKATLFFSGVEQSTTALSGDYYGCRPAQGNSCLQDTNEYGLWNVVLVS